MNSLNPLNSSACALFVGVVAATMLGCGGAPQADYASIGLVPVTGTVTLDDQPLEGAVVFFEAPDTTAAYATTDADGKYTMKFNSEVMGVPPGPKVVRISTTASTGESEETFEEEDDDAKASRKKKKARDPNEKVPDAYHSNSNIQVTVDDSTVVFDFALKSDGSPL